MYKLMTPGPTQVRENVLIARAQSRTNPDIDPDFFNFYQETCQLISSLLNTKNETLILAGEGILGLEAACASLTEPGDRVLVIDNGVFGKGFADFASLYGGEPVLFSSDYYQPVNPNDLRSFLKQDSNFKYATLVHCDTPSGILNDINELCPILKEFGILSVVDSVSGTFGEPVYVDDSQIDILCGGSQKVISAPPGLTFVTVSSEAKKTMKERQIFLCLKITLKTNGFPTLCLFMISTDYVKLWIISTLIKIFLNDINLLPKLREQLLSQPVFTYFYRLATPAL